MTDEEKKTLSQVRMDHARQCLKTARVTFQDGDYRSSANRSYYAIFHAMRSVLAFDGVDMTRHSGIISEFRRRYIKTGIFDIELSKIIDKAFRIRTEADYDDFYVVDIESIKKQIDGAERFLNSVNDFLKTK